MNSNVYSLRSEGSLTTRLSTASLLRFYANAYSECGQDGILQHIFDRCRIKPGLFVEFGAWDGCHLSNCRSLALKGWKGVSIECVPERFEQLRKEAPEGVLAICAQVGIKGGEGTPLDSILHSNGIVLKDVTFLSIDIDGSDLEVFESLSFSPPVILVEGGFNYNPLIIEKAPFEYSRQNNQHPLGAVIRIAVEKGYRAVCFFQDTYLVREDFAGLFKEEIELGTGGLYCDAWAFSSENLRHYLMELRARDRVLQAFEVQHAGYCEPDPTRFVERGDNISSLSTKINPVLTRFPPEL